MQLYLYKCDCWENYLFWLWVKLEVKDLQRNKWLAVQDIKTNKNKTNTQHLSSCSSFSGGMRVAFTASMSHRTNCFGPFTRNSSIPYDAISLNHGSGYNPALGRCCFEHQTKEFFNYVAYLGGILSERERTLVVKPAVIQFVWNCNYRRTQHITVDGANVFQSFVGLKEKDYLHHTDVFAFTDIALHIYHNYYNS